MFRGQLLFKDFKITVLARFIKQYNVIDHVQTTFGLTFELSLLIHCHYGSSTQNFVGVIVYQIRSCIHAKNHKMKHWQISCTPCTNYEICIIYYWLFSKCCAVNLANIGSSLFQSRPSIICTEVDSLISHWHAPCRKTCYFRMAALHPPQAVQGKPTKPIEAKNNKNLLLLLTFQSIDLFSVVCS